MSSLRKLLDHVKIALEVAGLLLLFGPFFLLLRAYLAFADLEGGQR